MKKRVGVLSLGLLMALIWTHGVPAASWDFIYECNDIPGVPVFADWILAGTSDICEITPDGELHMTDPADKTCHIMPPVDDVEQSTMEVRVKALSQTGSSYTILFGIEDVIADAWVCILPDHIEIYNGVSSHFLDMTEYHILRMTKDGDQVTVYVDDDEVMQGQATSVDANRQDNIIFGSGSTGGEGEHYWDYVVYTGQGAFSPAELPNYYISTQAVDSEGKIAGYWGTIKSQ